MPEDSLRPQTIESTNLVMPLVVAIIIAVIMVTTATLIFLNSSAYNTVKQIQIGTQVANSLNKSDIDTVSPIKASDIYQTYNNIKNQLNQLNDNNDFGPSAVTNQALDLTNY